MNANLIHAIVSYADRYRTENLTEDPRHLATDWWQAFVFFLGRACYQGRVDVVSDRVYDSALQVLAPLFSGKQRDLNYESQKREKWNVRTRLAEKIGKGKVGKSRDVEMIISALKFLDSLDNRNIVSYSVAKITKGDLTRHYAELQRSETIDGITQVGPKVAALYLRDVVSLFDLTDFVDNSSAFCLQPIDTWVQKVAERLGVVPKNALKLTTQHAIVKMCEKHEISALRFNQGAWYTGNHAFDLFLELLSNCKRGEAAHSSH